jgi:methylated-DNA-protein-cysteine methyltransferase-like protein
MRIPVGRVATYGQIARLARLPHHARQVGHALGQLLDDGAIPWHRVLSARGTISRRSDPACEALQRALLEAEGVVFDQSGRISLARFQWTPGRARAAP